MKGLRCGALLGAVGLALAACERASGELRAEDAWLRAAPAGQPMAGYVSLHNDSAHALRCDGADSADFGAVEIHRSVVEDGMARMLREQVIELPAGARARLEPGALHLMLFRPQRAFAPGASSLITLHCGERRLGIPFTIRSP